MEEKKLDINSIIGFILIFGILLWMLYNNQPTPEELQAQEQAKQEQIESENKVSSDSDLDISEVTSADFDIINSEDSLQMANLKNKVGAFAYSANAMSNSAETILENEVLYLKINNKGGYISEVKLKKYVKYDSLPVFLIKDQNSIFNINFGTSDNRTLNTKDLYFQPTVSSKNGNQIVSMKLKISDSRFLEYRYEIEPNNYMLDFTVKSQGLSNTLNNQQDITLDWKLKGRRQAKSISYENRYTRLTYQYEGDKIDKLAQMGDDEESEKDVSWLSFRQHFFSSILLTDKPFKTTKLITENLMNDEEIDTLFTKSFAVAIPLELDGGEFNESMNFYYGPTDSSTLKEYDKNLEESIPFGWGIFGWINKSLFIPLFSLLSGFFPYGIAIIIMTILVRLVLSPVLYKSYLSQAKMKILKPEIAEISEKYKDNAMKKQKETMALYNKAGANPMSGCLPAFVQLPVFYALFMFFPTAFELRQKSFLWADDLSSYDVVAELPFHIPFYGDHVSLFPILAAVAIFFYMKMTTGQQVASQPTQEGMPDMGKMMKYMIYFSPLMMLVFFNNYASGLSLYYFISNLITIGIMLVIKNYILDEDKIHAQMQENKKKPKKQGKFAKKMAEMMEKAEEQKRIQNRKK
ncbi:membrane protein insertase YidC [Flavobacteriaceae bacterium]|jgi:YidC/Oxa1 family membrane protein insertase|nr:membrane protein insertase YidC [Flavobacteriaceae bacterium]